MTGPTSCLCDGPAHGIHCVFSADESSPAQDLAARWVPTDDQIRTAVAMLDVNPGAYAVMVAIALPGKEHGWWTDGQPVEHVPGYWIATDRNDGYRAARDAASFAADVALGERAGQPSYAIIYRDGHAAMFEDIRSGWITPGSEASPALAPND